MLPQEIIRKKRDGKVLADVEIEAFVRGLTDGSVTEGQAAAFAMAVFFRGLARDERVALTRAMTRSGAVLDWSGAGLPGPVLDKHSSGGVGDKVSLILAPAVAACGGFVPMVSGRGLGHTGGTLDKVESIPGYRAKPDRALLASVVKDVGCAVIGATDDIAPADRRLYAIRDVTGSVESLDLIATSILSKKLAAGLDGLAMDVKFGSGAFMPSWEKSLELAETLADVGAGAGLPMTALLTDMNQVLGDSAGNALEMREAIAVLTGAPCDPRLWEVTRELTAEMLLLGRLHDDRDAARAAFDRAIASGAAAERMARMVAALGGPADLLESPGRHLAEAPVVRPLFSATPGVVARIDVHAVGMAVVALGGGRTRPEDPVDHAVGLTGVAGLGDRVGVEDRPLAVIHARTEAGVEEAAHRLRAAFAIGAEAPVPGPLIARRIGG